MNPSGLQTDATVLSLASCTSAYRRLLTLLGLESLARQDLTS